MEGWDGEQWYSAGLFTLYFYESLEENCKFLIDRARRDELYSFPRVKR